MSASKRKITQTALGGLPRFATGRPSGARPLILLMTRTSLSIFPIGPRLLLQRSSLLMKPSLQTDELKPEIPALRLSCPDCRWIFPYWTFFISLSTLPLSLRTSHAFTAPWVCHFRDFQRFTKIRKFHLTKLFKTSIHQKRFRESGTTKSASSLATPPQISVERSRILVKVVQQL